MRYDDDAKECVSVCYVFMAIPLKIGTAIVWAFWRRTKA